MSHEIETHGTQAAAVFARKDAWHRLGTTVRDRAFTAEEAMTLGHLGGWDVRKLPLTTAEVSKGGVTPIEVPGFATVRTNPFTGAPEALGVVGGGYTPLQRSGSPGAIAPSSWLTPTAAASTWWPPSSPWRGEHRSPTEKSRSSTAPSTSCATSTRARPCWRTCCA